MPKIPTDSNKSRKAAAQQEGKQEVLNMIDWFLDSVIYDLVTWIAIAFCVGLTLIYLFAVTPRNWRGVFWSLIALIICASIMIAVRIDQRFFRQKAKETQPTHPFSITIQSGLIDTTPPGVVPALLFSPALPPRTVYSLRMAVLVRLINFQDKAVTIDSFSVELEKEDGTRVKYLRIDGRTGRLLFVKKDGTFTILQPTDYPDLRAALNNTAIPPREPILGWLFLDMPSESIVTGKLFMNLSDADGRTYRETIQDQQRDTDALSGGALRPVGQMDITGFSFMKFGEREARYQITKKPN